MKKTDLEIRTEDDYPLKATLFVPDTKAKGSILLGSGLGIPKAFYFKYATFLAEHGYISICFDNRGIGKVEEAWIPEERMNLRNWAQEDMVAVLEYLSETYPNLNTYGILHSIGGQILGLMHNHNKFERVVTISTMGGYWRDEAFPVNLTTWFMWYIHIPVLTRLFGYLPKSLTYRGVAIAKGVAQEWADWGKKAKYISAFFGKSIEKEYYADVRMKMDALWFTDDVLATEKTLASVLDYYAKAQLKKWPLNPTDYGITKVGHSGFFSSKAKRALWELPIDILEGKHD